MSGCDEMPYKLRMKKFDVNLTRRNVIALVAYQSREHSYWACSNCWRKAEFGMCSNCGFVVSILRVIRRYIIYTADEGIEVSMSTRQGALEVGSFYDLVIYTAPTGTNYVLSAEERMW